MGRENASTSKPARLSSAGSGEFDSHTLPPSSSGSFAPLRISPAGSRFVHARTPTQLQNRRELSLLALASSTLTRFRQLSVSYVPRRMFSAAAHVPDAIRPVYL